MLVKCHPLFVVGITVLLLVLFKKVMSKKLLYEKLKICLSELLYCTINKSAINYTLN